MDGREPTMPGDDSRAGPPDVVILSGGLSGSSVLTGLLVRAGYWPGHETAKISYETWENQRLIDLNREIFRTAGHVWEELGTRSRRPLLDDVRAARDRIDPTPLREFVADCEAHRPFVWKDPRIVYTADIWAEHLDLARVRFVIADRDIRQLWTGRVLGGRKRIPLSGYRRVMEESKEASLAFCRARGIEPLEVVFEDLIARPESTVGRIARFLDIDLGVEDLRAVYTGELGQPRWSALDFQRARFWSLLYRLRG